MNYRYQSERIGGGGIILARAPLGRTRVSLDPMHLKHFRIKAFRPLDTRLRLAAPEPEPSCVASVCVSSELARCVH